MPDYPLGDVLLQGLRRWVETESHTPDTAGVNAMMDLAEQGFARTSARVERIAGRSGYGDHLRIVSAWGGEEPGVLVLCHLDSVHPKGTLARLPFRVEGDRAYGPAIYDMKGGAYLALEAFTRIARDGGSTPLPIRFLYVSDEEVGSPTSRALIEQEGERAKYVLVTEPARDGGKVVTGRRGTGRYTITTTGRPSHSGTRPQDGRSAIKEMARQILAIEALNDPARGINTNVGLIRGGTAANVVPAECVVEVDFRISRMADAEPITAFFERLKPHDPDVRLTVAGGLNRPPFEKSNAIAALFDTARGIAREIGFELADCFTGGGSDANFIAQNVATLDGLGVDGAGAHTLEEHLYISSLVPRLRLLEGLMRKLA
jgi:glutamate carboxypeptidase